VFGSISQLVCEQIVLKEIRQLTKEQEKRALDTARFRRRSPETRECLVNQEDQIITQPISTSLEVDSSSPTLDATGSFQVCPECDGHLLPTETSSLHEQLAYINIDSVAQFDQLLIETEKSTYIFTISDPTIRWGRLTGGVLGNRLLHAYLVPSELETNSTAGESLISVGNKVRFVLESEFHIKRVVTSNVIRLVHIKSDGGHTTPLKALVIDSEPSFINSCP